MESAVSCKKVADYAIGLGYLVDLRVPAPTFLQGIKQKYLNNSGHVTSNEQVIEDSTAEIVTSDVEAVKTITGSLEIELDLAKVISLKGKGSLDMEDRSETVKVTRAFNTFSTSSVQTVHLDDLKESDFVRPPHNSTHVVSSVTYGKTMFGFMTLETKKARNGLNVAGELEAKLAQFPIGGKGKVDYKSFTKNEDFSFTAKMAAQGGGVKTPLMNITSPANFTESVNTFLGGSKETKTIVSYTLEPLSGLRFMDPKIWLDSGVKVELRKVRFGLNNLRGYCDGWLQDLSEGTHEGKKKRKKYVALFNSLKDAATDQLQRVDDLVADIEDKKSVRALRKEIRSSALARFSVKRFYEIPEFEPLADWIHDYTHSTGHTPAPSTLTASVPSTTPTARRRPASDDMCGKRSASQNWYHGDPNRGHKFWVYPKDKKLVNARWDTHEDAGTFCTHKKHVFCGDQLSRIQEYQCLGHAT